MDRKIKVLIVDDHALVREGLRALLSLASDIEVVGEAKNGREALKKVRDLRPDVVLMDIVMPVMGGLEATRRIFRDFPETKVLVLTQYDSEDYVIPIIEAGAVGFVTKMSSFSDLAMAVRTVWQGGAYLSPSAAAVLVEERRRRNTEQTKGNSYNSLTQREREILKLIAEGHTTREIAQILFLSPKTVEWHRGNIMHKLKLRNRTELIRYAIRKGIITP